MELLSWCTDSDVWCMCGHVQEKGNCPMHVAAQAGQTAQVELLAVYGADPGARDANGRTPIEYAK